MIVLAGYIYALVLASFISFSFPQRSSTQSILTSYATNPYPSPSLQVIGFFSPSSSLIFYATFCYFLQKRCLYLTFLAMTCGGMYPVKKGNMDLFSKRGHIKAKIFADLFNLVKLMVSKVCRRGKKK